MKKNIALLLSLFLLSSLVACGPATTKTDSVGSSKASDSSAEVSVASSDSEQVELVLWDTRTEGPEAVMIDSIIAAFEAEYPGIKVKHSAFKDELTDLVKPALTSGEGPDIVNIVAGPGNLGVLAKAGLALDLTPYSEEYSWGTRFYDWALAKTVYDGKLYGIANELEILGVFYNKEIFEKNNLTPPKTYEDFLSICQVIKDQGITPVILDDKDQWPGFHYESIWLNSFAGPDAIKDAIQNKLPWTTAPFVNALDAFRKFVLDGYTTDKPLGLQYDDANSLFFTGEGAMRITGTWITGQAVEKMGDNVGFFYLPPASSDVASCPPGGLGKDIVISAKTKYPEQTVAFLDFCFRPETIRYWYEGGRIPSVKGTDYSQFNITPLFMEIVDEIAHAENMGENIDVLMPPAVNDVTMSYMQQLIAGKTTGEECMRQKQEAFESDIEAGNYSVN